jgi:hypothetical protein
MTPWDSKTYPTGLTGFEITEEEVEMAGLSVATKDEKGTGESNLKRSFYLSKGFLLRV